MAIDAGKLPKKPIMDAPLLDVGTYPARLVQVIDLGLQPGTPQFPEPKEQARLTYELVDEFMKDEEGNDLEDKPRWVSEEIVVYPPGTKRAKSTERFDVLDPGNSHNGNLAAMVGSPCNVSIGHNPSKKDPNKVYEKVLGLTAVRAKEAKKMEELKNPSTVFDLDDPDVEVFEKFPDFIKDKIKRNLKYPGSALAHALKDEEAMNQKPLELDDEVPW